MAQFLRHNRSGRAVKTTDGGESYEQRRDVTLASATIVGRAQIRRAVSHRDWQASLWDYFDTVGELRFAVRWLANAISRCTLYIGTHSDDDDSAPVPVNNTGDNELPTALLDALHYGQIGQAEMLRRMALHLSVPGETYLVGIEAQPDQGVPEKRWYVASNDELTVSSRGQSSLVLPETGKSIRLDPNNSTIIRMWIPHPRKGSEPDSAVRATLPVLREIKGLSDHISATIDSRLAGAGILKVPHSADAPAPQQTDSGHSQPLHSDQLTNTLMQSMLTPISDRDDASAVVPIVIKVPDEAVSNIEHITLDSELSDKVTEMRKDALERFATGADLPRDIVTGDSSSTNHWNAWQLEESSIKLHVEPLISVICDALTQQYLWPALRAAGVDDPTEWVVWYNASELSHRPNKSAEAQTLWDKGVLSTEALLRENGFSTEDLPSTPEHLRWITERIALSNPGLIPNLGEFLTPHNDSAPTGHPSEGGAEGEAMAPTGDVGATPTTQPDNLTPIPAAVASGAQESTWWLRTIEQVTLRALELAGKRVLGSLPRSHRHWKSAPRNVHPWDIHTVTEAPTSEDAVDKLLDGALDTATVNFSGDDCVLSTIESYCRHLLATGQPHRREYLATWLTNAGCVPQLQD